MNFACKRRDFAGALKFCREAHELAGKLAEPRGSQIRSQIEIQWATLLYRQGRILEAEEMFAQGFSHTHAAGCFPEMKPAHMVWGDLCTDKRRYAEAEQHYRLALHGEEIAGNLGGMIFVLQRLGDSLIEQGRRGEAEEVLNRAVELESRIVHEQMTREGQDPSQHVVISWIQPDLFFCQERYEDAKQIYRQKAALWEQSVTRPDNIDLGRLQMRLAVCEARTGDREKAIELFARAEQTFERDWGAGHPKTAVARECKELAMEERVIG